MMIIHNNNDDVSVLIQEKKLIVKDFVCECVFGGRVELEKAGTYSQAVPKVGITAPLEAVGENPRDIKGIGSGSGHKNESWRRSVRTCYRRQGGGSLAKV